MPADLVFEQLAQRLDQLQFHVIRQAADIVMRLDHMRLSRGGARRPRSHRIDGSLRQERDVLETGASSSKMSMNRFPMILRFCSGSETPLRPAESGLRR